MFVFEGSEVVREWRAHVTPQTGFSLAGVILDLPPQKANTTPIDYRAFQLKAEAMSLIVAPKYTPVEAWSQEGECEDNDSGDEAPQDSDVPPALSTEELVIFQRNHRHLHNLYHHARAVSFANAQGKAFVQKFCEALLSPEHQVLISTNPNGQYQPGSMSLQWVVGENRPGEGAVLQGSKAVSWSRQTSGRRDYTKGPNNNDSLRSEERPQRWGCSK